jgi:hypothetical protein
MTWTQKKDGKASLKLKKKNKLRGLSPRAKYADLRDNRLSAKLVPTFADRGCRVVKATDPYAVFSFCRPEPLLFLPSSSLSILTRLSGSRCRPTTSQKSGNAGNRTRTPATKFLFSLSLSLIIICSRFTSQNVISRKQLIDRRYISR